MRADLHRVRQFQAMSDEIKQQAGSRASGVSSMTSPDNIAEAHFTP